MAVTVVKVNFPFGCETVWQVLTDVAAYPAWRSDLGKTEILGGGRFVEYTKDGYATTFTVTREEPGRRWEFEMENGNMKGRWSGVLTPKKGGAEVELTEQAKAKKLWMRPFVKPYLKKQQAQFVADLQKALQERAAAPAEAEKPGGPV